MVNPSFEQAFTGPRAAGLNQFFTLVPGQWIALDAGEVPGWETTHPVVALGCPNGSFNYTPQYNCTPIELWGNNFNNVTPAAGIVLAELNAYTSSKLFQNICMNTGETFAFNFAHRGRGGPDQAQFQIGAGNTIILDVTTNTSGTGTINPGGNATSSDYAGTTTLASVSGSASSLSFTLPAGNYSDATANNVFDLPIRIINNAVVEDNKTAVLTMPANLAGNPLSTPMQAFVAVW